MYTEAKAKLPLAIAGELITPSSTDIDGHKKGKGKRTKQRTRRYLSQDTSESSDNEIRRNNEKSKNKQKKRSKDSLFIVLKVIFHGIVVSRYSETRITLPPVPNGLDISLFSSQPSNEVRHIREKIVSTDKGNTTAKIGLKYLL